MTKFYAALLHTAHGKIDYLALEKEAENKAANNRFGG